MLLASQLDVPCACTTLGTLAIKDRERRERERERGYLLSGRLLLLHPLSLSSLFSLLPLPPPPSPPTTPPSPQTTMSLKPDNLAEKHADGALSAAPMRDGHFGSDPESMVMVGENRLHQDLKGRHMQMIAMQVCATLSLSERPWIVYANRCL